MWDLLFCFWPPHFDHGVERVKFIGCVLLEFSILCFGDWNSFYQFTCSSSSSAGTSSRLALLRVCQLESVFFFRKVLNFGVKPTHFEDHRLQAQRCHWHRFAQYRFKWLMVSLYQCCFPQDVFSELVCSEHNRQHFFLYGRPVELWFAKFARSVGYWCSFLQQDAPTAFLLASHCMVVSFLTS